MRRSMLFVPGNNPKMMTSCGFFGADAIIFDLEDAVSPDEKDAARLLVKYAVKNVERCRSEIIVRVNAADTPLFAQDLKAIVPQKPDYIMLPKTASWTCSIATPPLAKSSAAAGWSRVQSA